MKRKKGTFELVENLFEDSLRSELPVNFYLMRSLNNTKTESYFMKSNFYNSDKITISGFYKSISNIL